MTTDNTSDSNLTIDLHGKPEPGLAVAQGLGPPTQILGVGGMGIVRAAMQHSLRREVAVKSIKPEFAHTRAAEQLLHEAYVAGLLDHPNVLPVHDIVMDDANQPHIVMKRVAGQAWKEWAFDAQRVRETFGVADLLSWNLGVLMQVCNAVAYAHDQGILHRDLKLENVMIGSFGEVLVLDWGIAVAIDARHEGRLPLARAQTKLAGTPSMMAPEMARCDGLALGPRTDVYLLGAMMYHIITGERPHRGASSDRIVASIPTSEVRLPASIPRELARIIEMAMCNDALGRYDTALALKKAIQLFLERRGSLRATHTALAKLELLKGATDTAQASRADVLRQFDEARFGLKHALMEWPENEAAREGLDQARTIVARWELQHGRPEAAAALLESMDRPPADVVHAVNGARAQQIDRDAELNKMRTYRDPKFGQRTRVLVIGTLGLTWIVGPVVIRSYQSSASWGHMMGGSAALLVLVLLLGLFSQKTLRQTNLNRATWIATLAIPVSNLLIDVCAIQLAISPSAMLLLRPALWFTIVLMYTMNSLRRAWPAPIFYALAALVSAALPEWGTVALTTASVGFLAVLARLWWTEELFDTVARAASSDRG